MNFLTFLHILNIIAIMSLAFYIRIIQGSKPYSLFWSIIFFLCFNFNGIKWFISHPVYLVRQLLFVILISIDITLIGQLIESSIFHRPIFMLMLSPIAWFLILLYNYYTDHREIKKL